MKTLMHKQPWFAAWFNSNYYHQLYRHRDNSEAEKFIDALINELQPAEDAVMLDLGCGTGRHSKYLATKGYTVFGLDLAASSIREARKSGNESLYFLNWDMRKPFGKKNFDFVFSFFTSFGYFNTVEENNVVVKNMATSLKRNGIVVIDYMNPGFVENQLVAVEEKEIDGIWYHINRWSDNKFIYKNISIQDGQQQSTISYTEQVAKFNLDDFRCFFEKNGMEMISVFGNYRLDDYNEQTSERMITVARKK